MAKTIFISYANPEDMKFALAISSALESRGIDCWMAPRDVSPGTKYSVALVDAIPSCRAFLLLLSRASNASKFVHSEVERAFHHEKPMLILRLEDVQPCKELEFFVSLPQWLDAFGGPLDHYLEPMITALEVMLAASARDRDGQPGSGAPAAPGLSTPPSLAGRSPLPEPAGAAKHQPAPSGPAPGCQRTVLLYKRNCDPDERLLGLIENRLRVSGHRVFIDRHLSVGTEWAKQIVEEVQQADAVVVLLSPDAVKSEMLAYEVQVANEAAQQRGGKPKVLPVRIGFEGPLPPELENCLGHLQYFLWEGSENDEKLVSAILEALNAPASFAPRREKLEAAGGAVPLDSAFYVVRPPDGEFHTALLRGDATILIKGARQMGKTSLLARGLKTAREAGCRVVFSDYQKLTNVQLETHENFLIALGELMADQLDLEVSPREGWTPARGPNSNFERFIRRNVLAEAQRHLVWAMDEVDRLFSCPFGSQVFALFRTWHNERALDPSGPWSRLTLAIAYATEAYLFISDPNQSPFNVGTRVALDDFTLDQVSDLNGRYGSPLSAGEVERLYDIVGGQPYLVRRSLNEISSRGLKLDQFETVADRDDGPLGDHLRRMLVLLVKDASLCDAVRALLRGASCPDFDSFYRLRSSGVILGNDRDHARLRCRAYASYLRSHLS